MREGEREITVYAEIFSGHIIPIHGDGLGMISGQKKGENSYHVFICI